MKPGRHAAGDGSFGRSAGASGGRGFALIAFALLLGSLVLSATDDEPPGARVSATRSPEGRPQGGGRTTTTLAAPTTTTLPSRSPGEVKVIVANATRTKGAAAKVSDQLRPAGYNVLAPTDALATEATSVLHEAGFEREAAAVATALQLPPSSLKPIPSPVPVKGGDIRGANVVVVAGPDLVGRLLGTPAASGATTTTAARATRTTAARSGTSTTARATSSTTATP